MGTPVARVPAAGERLYVRLDGDPLYAPETSVPAGTLREMPRTEAAHAHAREM